MFNKVLIYLQETRAEFRHVKWLSRRALAGFTAAVIIISLIVAAFLGAFDFLFSFAIGTFVL